MYSGGTRTHAARCVHFSHHVTLTCTAADVLKPIEMRRAPHDERINTPLEATDGSYKIGRTSTILNAAESQDTMPWRGSNVEPESPNRKWRLTEVVGEDSECAWPPPREMPRSRARARERERRVREREAREARGRHEKQEKKNARGRHPPARERGACEKRARDARAGPTTQ